MRNMTHRELANRHVHVGLDGELARRLQNGHARRHGTTATCFLKKIRMVRVASVASVGPSALQPVPTRRPVSAKNKHAKLVG